MGAPERLYSRGFKNRCPVDEIAPQHDDIHRRLCRWGSWNSARAGRRGLASVEALYSRFGKESATLPADVDKDILAIEKAVVRMPEQHRDTLRMLYVRRFAPHTICRVLHLRYEGFQAWSFACRAMVVNLLRRYT